MNLSWLWNIILPKFCLGCNVIGYYICPDCESKINFYNPQTCPYCERGSLYGLTHPRCQKPWGLDGMFVLGHYDGLIRQVIHQVKYKKDFALLEDTAELLIKSYNQVYTFEYLVPIPLSKEREEERGFNQAEKLGKSLSFSLSLRKKQAKVLDILIRTRETKPQFDLKYEQRQDNVHNAFSLNSKLRTPNLSGYSFCLVDDVATTGSTIFECAKVLKRAGAEKVYAMVLARGG